MSWLEPAVCPTLLIKARQRDTSMSPCSQSRESAQLLDVKVYLAIPGYLSTQESPSVMLRGGLFSVTTRCGCAPPYLSTLRDVIMCERKLPLFDQSGTVLFQQPF